MTATDYQGSPHTISYEQPSGAERQAAGQLAQARHNLGPMDITHDVAMDEVPD
ncbi:hypothetical protein IV498_10315 [Paenarthrobacter sp. Z7-10]|uniref:hypothetical protein n=1 Tax=Paenarthrobacter sp. Z7-10 TaxID=2787635 RepID=UPI0022A9CB7B|nr:hypothetical protein [Paenarthrobacter sp. Z7-10]MCZ2403564.1 hypothetical protein [Paenarthrobacter sp. Z7-10]